MSFKDWFSSPGIPDGPTTATVGIAVKPAIVGCGTSSAS